MGLSKNTEEEKMQGREGRREMEQREGEKDANGQGKKEKGEQRQMQRAL